MAGSTTDRSALTVRLRPDKWAGFDVAAAVLLVALAVAGLQPAFAGNEELLVGIPAVLAGALVAYVLVRLSASLVVGVALAGLAYFLLSGALALRSGGIGGIIPTPATLGDAADGLVNGWARLLTTLPPAGRAGNLVMVPYTCGFVGGGATVGLASRWPGRLWCAVPPVVVLAVAILFGVDRPASALLQGGGFGAVLVAWCAVRSHRRTPTVVGSSRGTSRLVPGAALLGVASAVGVVAAPALPFVPEDRYVLREEVVPPFDPRQYASPLVAFRTYAGEDAPLFDVPVMTVEGLPEGARIRLGVLDDFDGLVWRASGDGRPGNGSYRRVGTEVAGSDSGEPLTIRIQNHALGDVWVPLVGSIESVSFEGDRAASLDEAFRFNRAAEAGAVTGSLEEGDVVVLRTVVARRPDDDELAELAVDPAVTIASPELPPEVEGIAADLITEAADGAGGLFAQAGGLGTLLRQGAYSDGGPDAVPLVPAGHSLARLARFLQAEQLVGNGEQYAAAAALVLRSRGIPARVVMGFVPEDDPDGGAIEVTGADVEAWIEVPFAGIGWVSFDVTPPETNRPEPQVDERTQQDRADNQPPPPTVPPAPSEPGDDLDAEDSDPGEREDDGSRRGIVGLLLRLLPIVALPLVVIAVPCGLIVLLKALRRRRRRLTGSMAARAAGGWQEVVDLAIDLGRPMPRRATRLEAARLVGVEEAGSVALRTETVVFGPAEPTDADVDVVWRETTSLRDALLHGVARSERLRAAISLSSLRAGS